MGQEEGLKLQSSSSGTQVNSAKDQHPPIDPERKARMALKTLQDGMQFRSVL